MYLLESLVLEMNKSQLAGSCMAVVFQWCVADNKHVKYLNEQIYLPAYFYYVASSSPNE